MVCTTGHASDQWCLQSAQLRLQKEVRLSSPTTQPPARFEGPWQVQHRRRAGSAWEESIVFVMAAILAPARADPDPVEVVRKTRGAPYKAGVAIRFGVVAGRSALSMTDPGGTDLF